MENIIWFGKYAEKQRGMKCLLAFGVAVILIFAFTGCQAEQSPLVGLWHTESGNSLPLKTVNVEFNDEGFVNVVDYHVFGVGDYYGYGPSGTYGVSENKIIFGFSGGSSHNCYGKYGDKGYLEMSESYPDRVERYFEIDGDTLYLYETPDKTETPDVFLTGVFKQGAATDCDLYKAYFAYE